MSLEICVIPPPPINIFQTDTIERGANAVGISIPPTATTESTFCMGGGGYNDTKGIISRKNTLISFG